MRKLPPGRIDLIYIDPPFNSNRNYEVFGAKRKRDSVSKIGTSRKGKRNIENAVVEAITSRPNDFGLTGALEGFREQISSAAWRVLSARRADNLLRKKLFERAYALRVRGFAMNYRGAELDMHFSISSDLNLLEDMLRILRDDWVHALSVYLERRTL